MSLHVASLNSGSNGNCYYISNDTEAVLIDAGISCREIEQRMKILGLCMKKIKAVFVSHEHADHIRGISVLVHKYNLPVYITSSTLRHGRFRLDMRFVHLFTSHKPVIIGELYIVPFPKLHDAADPYSFTVTCRNIKVGIFTDIGTPCENVTRYFKQCNAAFLETNYDERMLEEGNYPYYLKNRIRGNKGHLSNTQALSLFLEHRPSFMSHLFLSHLSKNNNCPRLVLELFNSYANGINIIVASRNEQSEIFHIRQMTEKNTNLQQRRTFSQLRLPFPPLEHKSL